MPVLQHGGFYNIVVITNLLKQMLLLKWTLFPTNIPHMRYLILALFIFQSCVTDMPISITQFTTLSMPTHTDTSLGKKLVYFDDFFLITNFKESKSVENEIDSFVNNYISGKSYPDNTEEIKLYFYRETSKTNLKAIEKNPREIDRYSNDHDIVYCYFIRPKGISKKEKIKNGEIIETTPKPIPKPNFKILPSSL